MRSMGNSWSRSTSRSSWFNKAMPTATATTTTERSGETFVPVAVFRCDGVRIPATQKVAVEPVDFRNPTYLAEGEMRRLRNTHHEYLRALTARLSGLLRSEIVLDLGKFGTQSCESFIEGLKNPN